VQIYCLDPIWVMDPSYPITLYHMHLKVFLLWSGEFVMFGSFDFLAFRTFLNVFAT